MFSVRSVSSGSSSTWLREIAIRACPRPSSVNHSKLQHIRFKVARTPLPPMTDSPRLVSRIPTQRPEAPEEQLSPILRALAEAEKSPERRITVTQELLDLHPQADKSFQALTNGKPNEWGYPAYFGDVPNHSLGKHVGSQELRQARFSLSRYRDFGWWLL